MARKGYKRKTCAYCAKEGASEVREHVLCRELFLIEDRAELPMVPACSPCNTKKSALETYALTLLPVGSLHANNRAYLEANLKRRLEKNPSVAREMFASMTPILQRVNGLLLPTGTVSIDNRKIEELLKMVVQGLFRHLFGTVLHRNWSVRVTMLPDEQMRPLFQTLVGRMGPGMTMTKLYYGRGTFTATIVKSAVMPNASVWTFKLFGGMRFGGDSEHLSFAYSTFTAVTIRSPGTETMPFEADELPAATLDAA